MTNIKSFICTQCDSHNTIVRPAIGEILICWHCKEEYKEKKNEN